MKKIFALILAVTMVLSFAACSEEERPSGVTSGPSVDKNTIEIVNNAFVDTQKAIESAKALGYGINAVVSVTVDDVTTSIRMSSDIGYLDTDGERVFAIESETRSGDMRDIVCFYNDAKDIYAHRAGETFLLVGKGVDEYFTEEFNKIKVIDTTGLKALDTTIVDAANDGHGFVIEYDTADKSFDISKIVEDWKALFDSKELKDLQIKFTGASVSGIVDASGKLTSESFKLEYEYKMDVEVPKTDVDPDNSEASETTEIVTKTIKCELSFDIVFDFDLTEVDVPDEITVIGEEPSEEGEDEPKKPDEISLTDFQKLDVSDDSDDKDKD